MVAVRSRHRRGAAAIDLRTGRVTDWNPRLDGSAVIDALAVAGSRVYLAGFIRRAAGLRRPNLAAVSRSDGRVVRRWNPRADARVGTLAVIGNTVYVGGHFTTLGGAHRRHLAELDATTRPERAALRV